MLFREASKEIVKWIESGKDALLVAGARQVGKTYLIRELLKERKIDYVEFNFVKQPGLLSTFKPALEEDEKTFLENLRIASLGL